MISKYTLILFTILLATAAISGCTDADAPETLFNEQAIQELLDNNVPINDINDMINVVAKSNNYDVDVVKSDSTGKIVSIGVDDGEGNHVRFINDDANPDVDRATLNGKQIYPTTGEAESPQTQLSEGASSDDTAIQTAGGYTLDDLFDLARDDPEGFLDKDIEKYKLTGLGPTTDENSDKSILIWDNPTPGIELYKEEYNYEGDLKLVRMIKKQGTGISIYDATKNNNEDGQDGKIDIVLNLMDGKQTITKAE